MPLPAIHADPFFGGLSPMEWMNQRWNQYVRGPSVLCDPVAGEACAGLYFLWLGDRLRYVGLSVDMERRVQQHSQTGRIEFDRWRTLCVPEPQVVRFFLQSIECAYIRALAPPDNRHKGSAAWPGTKRMAGAIREAWTIGA